MAHWHHCNPWATRCIYVPDLGELAECASSLGKDILNVQTGARETVTKEWLLDYWQGKGPKLDAYILQQPDGMFEAGIRYGREFNDYLSPAFDSEKLAVLAIRYGVKWLT